MVGYLITFTLPFHIRINMPFWKLCIVIEQIYAYMKRWASERFSCSVVTQNIIFPFESINHCQSILMKTFDSDKILISRL